MNDNDLKKQNEEVLNALNILKNQKAKIAPNDLQKDSLEKDLINNEKSELSIDENQNEIKYPSQLANDTLERIYIGLLLNEIKAISAYYFEYDECYFNNEMLLNIYKKILFTDGEKFAPVKAKDKFNFPEESTELYNLKNDLKYEFQVSDYKLEKTYQELKKIFILRKHYMGMPVKDIQAKIADIMNYELYDKMNWEDVEEAIKEVTTTDKFKRAVLNNNITEFLIKGDNTLTNGLSLPFTILTEVFKGIRTGETSAFAMPSNSGKSRFIINLAANIALIHKQKVLIISNEMSEEKMKLCLITTILNNPEIQKLYGEKIKVSENELLDFKNIPEETRNLIIKATDWININITNSIYFIDITDHTNDELKKVIMNYYYKEKINYVFYDTLKTDIENIGNAEELKKTATILSNLAQNYNMYIGSTLQLAETMTDPINLNVNDMAVSRTVKEVLDTLCLFKQIHEEDFEKYQYSLDENDENVFELEKFKDPNVRYYSCIVDKNRAGAKPKLLFRLNLAYNNWEELGYLRLRNK